MSQHPPALPVLEATLPVTEMVFYPSGSPISVKMFNTSPSSSTCRFESIHPSDGRIHASKHHAGQYRRPYSDFSHCSAVECMYYAMYYTPDGQNDQKPLAWTHSEWQYQRQGDSHYLMITSEPQPDYLSTRFPKTFHPIPEYQKQLSTLHGSLS